jgi:hypothetical protein
MALTNFSNVTTFVGFLGEANNQTSGYFWSSMNLLVFLVLFITMTIGFGWESAFFAAGFVSILISMFLMYLGLQSMQFTGMIIGGILLLFIFLMWSNRNN